MSEPFLVTEPLADTVEVDVKWSLDAAIVVTPPVDEIDLETDALIGQGIPGPMGPSPSVSKYGQANASVVAGVLTLNAAAASTFWVELDADVAQVVVENWAEDKAQRVHVYTHQVSPGNWTFDTNAWPAGTRWSYGARPQASVAGTIESFVLEHLPIGNLVFGALVGQQYS